MPLSRPSDGEARRRQRGLRLILTLPVAALACNFLLPRATPSVPALPVEASTTAPILPSEPPASPPPPNPTQELAWVTLRLINDSSSPICYVLVDPSFHAVAGSTLWYDVATAGEPIAPGASYDFAGVPQDTYDLHAQDCSYATVDLRSQVPVLADYDWVITESQAGQTFDLILQNDSSTEICTVYLSRRGMGYTETEVATSLAPGASQTFPLQPGPYDLWVADCTGGEFGITFGVDLVSCSRWMVTGPEGELVPGCD